MDAGKLIAAVAPSDAPAMTYALCAAPFVPGTLPKICIPTTSGTGVQALVVDAHKPPSGDNVKRSKLAVLARPYPRAVAGTPTGYGFDPATKRFHLEYSTTAPNGERLQHKLQTEVFLPRIQYPHGHYEVHVEGAEVVSDRRSKVLRLERDKRAKKVALTVLPAERQG